MSDSVEINRMFLERGRKALAGLRAMNDDPIGTNTELLMRIVNDNKDTEYGKKVGLGDVSSIEDYKKKIPFSVFDDYAEYVIRELTGKERNLHSVYEVKQYNKSSGTMGNPKKIPMSKISMEYFIDYVVAYPYAVAAEELGEGFVSGKTLSVMEASGVTILPDGKRYVGVSAQTLFDWNYTYSDAFTSPREAMVPSTETNARYLHARYGLAEKNVTVLHTTFTTFILDLFHYIENNWEMICDDIESGKIDPSVRMPDDVRAKLESELVPMPERAAELRKIFSEGFDNTITKRLWPNIQFMSGIGTGTFAAYLRHLREGYVGDLPVFLTGVSASEGAFTVPYRLNDPASVPVANTIFMEFLPLGEEDPSKTRCLDEVEVGEEYEMVITTLSGFYRYRTRDAVRIVGKTGNTPTMEYLYRIDMCINLNGEKTYEPALRKAMDDTSKEMGFRYVDFCVNPNTEVAPSCYEFFIEMSSYPKDMDMSELRKTLQKNLIVANPLLAYKFERDLCGPVQAHILQDETYLLYRDKQILMGAASTQVKPVKIIMNEAQLRFFAILVEKEMEQ